ncbi:MAG: dicarboxylate/amino acid:cation symporter [Zhenhengia sp.]|uniref:Dicarboxylate/amino acid:cation symporter n=1 Tax=Zhenhengia yiwuensis TaxID=2763666 RepID=A0A926EKU7_9FIRM|nr:dicarboxylate/amino acid:cation symporter [Zhenhengia yiwuensis]MBC8580900.1 dicarboxylate/amino acid:cation symporter [Zhenhengia yiwuensis]MBS5798991.1 dicarboxylate/amino acid:cation symporter [Clostridiales bacterium]
MKNKLGLSSKIFIGLILGVFLGMVIQFMQLNALLTYIIQPTGTIFLNLMKMVIVPLILCTLVSSMTHVGDMNRLGVIGKKTLLYYMGTTLMAAFIGMSLALFIKPGMGITLEIGQANIPEATPLMQMLVDIVPTNPFKALVEGNTLQVIIFGAFTGIAINSLGNKAQYAKAVFNDFADVMYKIVEMIMKITPIAVCALIADVVATNGWGILISLIKLIVVILVASLIQCLVVYVGSAKIFAGMNPMQFIKSVLPAQMISFSTASSAAALPVSLKCAKENLGIKQEIAQFVLNIGSTINMDGGAIYQSACAVFIAQLYGIELSFTQLIILLITASLASVGAAAIPGTVIVMMTMVLTSIGLPLEAIALIAGVDRILDMITTSVNVTGDLSACVFVSSCDAQVTEENYLSGALEIE